MLTRISATLALAICALTLRAQVRLEYSESGETLFREALARYDAGAYREAAVGFDRCIQEAPTGQRITAAYVMKGKALFHVNENLEAAKTLKAFLAKFPMSAYAPDAELTLGLVYARIERYDESMELLFSAFRGLGPSSPPRLTAAIVAALDTIVDGHLGETTLNRYLSRAATTPERAYLLLKLAQKNVASENTVGASIILDSLSRYPLAPLFSRRADDLRARISTASKVKLGALVPLMRSAEPSAAKDVGNEVYEGILFAAEKYSHDVHARVSVTLETRDTERETQLAITGARELADDKDVVGIVGPVFSPSVMAAATVANARGIPLITPTANANGIAATGKFVFQANPDYDARGRAMALYAVRRRNFHTLAVLAPTDTYAKYLAEGFVREAVRLGARVLATEWYSKGTSDLKPQLEKIRRAGILEVADAKISFSGRLRPATLMKLADLGVPLKRLDSLMSKGGQISAHQLLGARARPILDSLMIPLVYDESHVDSLEYPVEAIDALYAPISGAEEIGIVSSQVVYFNFKSQLLGSGEWNSFAELNANRRYTDGVIFESDTFIDTSSGPYPAFAAGFAERFKKAPTKNTLFGYDTADLLLSLISAGATTRDALERALSGVRDFRGVHSQITLGADRVNSWLTILKYDQDEIQTVEQINAEREPEGGVGEGTQKK
ncbi:MAG TPA: ABC transporter substrate-binding protein [Bacteroidota bacterium]|nr:ABC transporter substrate-binding protein [Bacteroidota bacterium]